MPHQESGVIKESQVNESKIGTTEGSINKSLQYYVYRVLFLILGFMIWLQFSYIMEYLRLGGHFSTVIIGGFLKMPNFIDLIIKILSSKLTLVFSLFSIWFYILADYCKYVLGNHLHHICLSIIYFPFISYSLLKNY